MSLDPTRTLSRVDLPYSTMASSDAADSSVAASNSSSTGFDLINHAIRMGTSAAKPITTMDVSSTSESATTSSELLLRAHLLDRAAANASNTLSRVSSTSSNVGPGPMLSHHELASASQPYANLVRQQLGSGGIVAALQRRHSQQSLEGLPAGLSLQLASYLGAAAAAATPASAKSIVPPSSPPPKDARQTQDEQNARQLNPNAFQFPWKLHDMLDRSSTEGYDDVVSWVDNGEAFRVHLPDVFVESVMSRFFKQTKYKSFQRQLNLYGFTRLHNGANKGGYKHKYFRQGQRTMCQLITRCPIRDSSSAGSAVAAIAAAVASEDSITRMVVDEDTSSSSVPAALTHAVSNASLASKTSASSINQKQQPPPSQADAYHHAAAMLAARQQAITSSFHLMEKAHQEQQLQQLQLQQLEAHRLAALQQQQQREIPLTSSYVPGMPLAGTDHSVYPTAANRTSSISPPPAKAHLLDASNTSSLVSEGQESGNVTPNSTKFTDKEKLSMFHKEFQFPWKLYEMLERANKEDFSSLVSWMPGDSSFKVHDAENFVKTVMPRFFKQTKYKSFQRQLNLYGFTRVDTGPNKGGYRHFSFRKGRKDLLVNINRIKIKGNGRPRGSGSNTATIISDGGDSSDNLNRAMKSAAAVPSASVPENISGIAVILKAIKAKEGSEAAAARAPPVSDVMDTTSDSNSTIPSTIDVQMKESLNDSKHGPGLSWRQSPSESFSDWTIEVVEEDNAIAQPTSNAVYHVHRRVLAVGTKKSDFFANVFKTNASSNRSQLRLSKKEAGVFPMALDYIYADIDFDLDTEKAYALYSLGERLQNTSIIQTVTEFYCKWCMTKSNIVEFLKVGQSFQNKSLLEAAVLKCSQEIWFMDAESASKIDPGLLLRILVIATSMARNQETRQYDSLKLSQMVAISVTHASAVTLTLEIFRSLTNKLVLPALEPIAAIELLATENTLLSVGAANREGLTHDPSFHERCVSAIHKDWDMVRKRLSESSELANAMKSIPSMVLYDVLMKTTTTNQ